MFMEALQILQSTGEDENSFVTDFGLYKVIYVLTVYFPFLLSTFLLSQEFLGKKIACFPPENVVDHQVGPMSEYCWNNGLWIGEDDIPKKSLFTQPHRYYAFYLPLQAIFCISPIILWNICTKTKLMAVLKGAEEYFGNLTDILREGPDEQSERSSEKFKRKIKGQLRQFHQICLAAARESNLSYILIGRQVWELGTFSIFLMLQYYVYNHNPKTFVCKIPELTTETAFCTVPVLDMLDIIWTINTVCLIVAIVLVSIFITGEVQGHFSQYQPMFINELPYGDEDDFNEKVEWDSNFTKHSYELLTLIMLENNAIMTKVYVLNAMKPDLSQIK